MATKSSGKAKKAPLPAKEVIEIADDAPDPFLQLRQMAKGLPPGSVHVKMEEEDIEMSGILDTERGGKDVDLETRPGAGNDRLAFPLKRPGGVNLVAPLVQAELSKMKDAFTIEAGGSRDGNDSPPASNSGSATPGTRSPQLSVFWDLGNLDATAIATQFLTDHINDLMRMRTELTILHENLLRTRIVAAKTKHCLSRALFTTQTGQDMQEEIRRRNIDIPSSRTHANAI